MAITGEIMTTAKNKQHFIERWENHTNELSGLYNTAKSLKTMDEIEEAIENVKKLIYKIADEGYKEE